MTNVERADAHTTFEVRRTRVRLNGRYLYEARSISALGAHPWLRITAVRYGRMVRSGATVVEARS